MSKHTEGEWEFLRNTNSPEYDLVLDRKIGIRATDEGRGGSWIAVIEGDVFDDEEQEANARLIASAPKMLSALQFVLANHHEGRGEFEDIVIAAIEAATGEKP